MNETSWRIGGWLAIALLLGGATASLAQDPVRSCSDLEAGSIEQVICREDGLVALDASMRKVLTEAYPKTLIGGRSTLAGDQFRWKSSRADCLNAVDRRLCLEEKYRLRIAEVQARYALVTATGPFTYVCREVPLDEVVATFFATDPPTLIATRAGKTSVMILTPGPGAAHYHGPHESFREHDGEARITWEPVASELFCTKRPVAATTEKP